MIRFTSTCLSLDSSVEITKSLKSHWKSKDIGLRQVTIIDSTTDLPKATTSQSFILITIPPVSMRDKSSTSLIRLSNASEFCLIISLKCAFSSEESVIWSLVNKLEKPTMELRGVRISWLMLARKADFILLDSSALSLAIINSSLWACNSSFILRSLNIKWSVSNCERISITARTPAPINQSLYSSINDTGAFNKLLWEGKLSFDSLKLSISW